MKRITGVLATALCAAAIGATPAPSPVPMPIPAPNFPVAATALDNGNGFSFEYGTWRTHYRLLRNRLAGDHVWYDCYGTSVTRPFWNGRGNLEDGDLKCPTRYIGGLTLRLYDARTHQWTLWWGTRALAVAPPPQIGHFDADGVGRFYAYDSWKGTPVINRFKWTIVRGNPHFEQAYSTDGGKTWETNWTTDYERVSPATKGVWNAVDPVSGASGFAFLVGRWKTHERGCDGTAAVRSFWGGSGVLEDAASRCGMPDRSVALNLYDAAKHQWLLYSATESAGLTRGLPNAGRFDKDGVGDFFAPAQYDGKHVIVRDHWEPRDGHPRFERAVSYDDGQTWQTVRTIDYVRSS